jgi:caffeoyl-CoA O-methyltransferase
VSATPDAPRPVTPVGILAALLDDLVTEVGSGSEDWKERLRRARDLAGGLEPYLADCTTPASPSLVALEERTRHTDWSGGALEAEMLSGHVEGQLLRTLVRATRARRVLEIGMFTGYSALAMAQALPDDGEVVACELDAEVAAFAREMFDRSPGGERIAVRVGPALATLDRLAEEGQVFDLVFLDADKAGYADYLDRVLTGGLLAPHGLLCVDNTLLQGEPWSEAPTANGRAVRDFNRAVASDPRVEQVLVPLRDGVSLLMHAPTTGAA